MAKETTNKNYSEVAVIELIIVWKILRFLCDTLKSWTNFCCGENIQDKWMQNFCIVYVFSFNSLPMLINTQKKISMPVQLGAPIDQNAFLPRIF